MTDGASQGLFIVVAVVIFGIFVSLSYTVFGNDGLSGGLGDITSQALDNTMKNVGVKSLVYSSSKEVDRFNSTNSGTREFMWYGVDLSPIFDEHGIGKYLVEFEAKAAVAGSVDYYMLNSTNSEYSWGRPNVSVTTEYQKFSNEVTVRHTRPELSMSQFAFYGGYDTGRYPTVRNVRIYKLID